MKLGGNSEFGLDNNRLDTKKPGLAGRLLSIFDAVAWHYFEVFVHRDQYFEAAADENQQK
jgi:hypothetical protein